MFGDSATSNGTARAPNPDLAIARALVTILEAAVRAEDFISLADIAEQLAAHARSIAHQGSADGE